MNRQFYAPVSKFDLPTGYNAKPLGGWFDGFCPSNGIANSLEGKAKNARAEKAQWDKKYNALKTGSQAKEWAELKKDIAELEDKIEKLTLELQKEEGIIDALGIGLGAWCNGAVSRRKRAETALRDAERALGIIKGSYTTLQRQQNDGIRLGNQNLAKLKNTIKEKEQQIAAAKQKIAAYKAKRDNEAASQNQEDKNKALKGKFMENAPVIAGVLGLGALAIYMAKNKKKKSAPRKVVA